MTVDVLEVEVVSSVAVDLPSIAPMTAPPLCPRCVAGKTATDCAGCVLVIPTAAAVDLTRAMAPLPLPYPSFPSSLSSPSCPSPSLLPHCSPSPPLRFAALDVAGVFVRLCDSPSSAVAASTLLSPFCSLSCAG